MTAVPGAKAISAQHLQTIDMAVSISVLCVTGGFQTLTPNESTVRPVEPHHQHLWSTIAGGVESFQYLPVPIVTQHAIGGGRKGGGVRRIKVHKGGT
jgi:hypothetical protein